MDHIKILKRAWEITRHYRVLWVFGVILALTSGSFQGSGGGGGGGGDGSGISWSEEYKTDLDLSPEAVNTLIAIAIGAVCLILFLVVVGVIAHYVAQTTVIRMVNEYEDTGKQRSVRQGFRLGWSRAARRLFLLDLSIGLPRHAVLLLGQIHLPSNLLDQILDFPVPFIPSFRLQGPDAGLKGRQVAVDVGKDGNTHQQSPFPSPCT